MSDSNRNRNATLIAQMQDAGHGRGYDYGHGSPHLSHPSLRNDVLGRIRQLVAQQFARAGRCRVLEVGAGHGAFTDHVMAMGAEVTVTEMSRPSLEVLRERYAHNPRAALIYDDDGDAIFRSDTRYDLVLCVSVLHHIPDYERYVRRAIEIIEPGGSFASFQDPLWYPRRSTWDVRFDRLLYFAWRLRQGEVRRGIATRLRRARGVYDEDNPADMVEYHVVRQGVDEELLLDITRPCFADVSLWRYFSTQGSWLQRLGEKIGQPTTFGLIATGRIENADTANQS